MPLCFKKSKSLYTKTFELHLSSSRLEAAAEKGPKLKLVIDDTVDYGGNTAGGVRQYPIRSGSVSTNTFIAQSFKLQD